MKVKMQLFINGRYAAKAQAQLGTEQDQAEITRLFQTALVNLDPTRSLEVVVTKREDT